MRTMSALRFAVVLLLGASIGCNDREPAPPIPVTDAEPVDGSMDPPVIIGGGDGGPLDGAQLDDSGFGDDDAGAMDEDGGAPGDGGGLLEEDGGGALGEDGGGGLIEADGGDPFA